MRFVNRSRALIWSAIVVVCAGGIVAGMWAYSNVGTSQSVDAPPLPAIRQSPFTNTELAIGYVGSQACKSCHEDAHDSYLQTAHSKALMDLDPANEPPDGEFTDTVSKKTYRIQRRDGQMFHEESILAEDGSRMVLSEFPVRYVIGSGRFSRSYLVEMDNFLYESPATWYAARPGWALSPGYEHHNVGFQRPVEFRCLSCHAGRIDPVDNSPQRVHFHSLVIDCERCHGPGAQHVASWENSVPKSPHEGVDLTIVNPAHLERGLSEDICAQCHLHSAATVEMPGRRLNDYRPGLWLSDFVTHYGKKHADDGMQVVGHMEQMRLSECYQKSETLTCTTCHDPHATHEPVEQSRAYRLSCLKCHAEEACSEQQEVRFAEGRNDDCVGCHMPSTDTEIPHFAFTHHRIGIHRQERDVTELSAPRELVPLSDISWQPRSIQKRNLGLAYLQFSDAHGQASFAAEYNRLATSILANSDRLQPGDSEVQAALSRLFWNRSVSSTLRYAESANRSSDLSSEAEATIAYTFGTTQFSEGKISEALPWLKRTTELRPTADVWYMLSQCYDQLGDGANALSSARKAVRLAPDRPRFVEHLVNQLRSSGAISEATDLELRLQPLRKYREEMDHPSGGSVDKRP